MSEKRQIHYVVEAERDLIDRREKIIRTKELLLEEETVQDLYNNGVDLENFDMSLSILPILHNEGKIILQFHGWSINLLENGKWFWEATDDR